MGHSRTQAWRPSDTDVLRISQTVYFSGTTTYRIGAIDKGVSSAFREKMFSVVHEKFAAREAASFMLRVIAINNCGD